MIACVAQLVRKAQSHEIPCCSAKFIAMAFVSDPLSIMHGAKAFIVMMKSSMLGLEIL